MSTQLDPSDLIGEDGTVDHSVIKSITNAAAGGHNRLSPERCDEFRRCIADGMTAKVTAREYGVGATAVRRHVRGECHHLESQTEEPAHEYIRGTGWVVADE